MANGIFFILKEKKGSIKIQLYPGQIGDRLSKGVSPGKILGIRDGFLEIACIDRSYLVSRLKPESSRILTPEQFVCGYVSNK